MVNDDIDRLRHSATRSLFERRDTVVVASVSCIYGLGMPTEYAASGINISCISAQILTVRFPGTCARPCGFGRG